MNTVGLLAHRDELRRQAGVARKLGSSFVAAVLEAGQRQLDKAPRTAALISNWPGDPSAAALAMRFNAALHALARREAVPGLSALYRRRHDDYDDAVGAALAAQDDFICEWMRYTPQTNEVGRAAAIGGALMAVRQRTGLPFELLELGSSCGLNLNLARYAYDLGGVAAGQPNSPVRIAPAWRGSLPIAAPLEVVSARGVDLNPLNPADAATRERLLAFVWADQPERARRLEHALALAQLHPPRVDQGDAASWLAERLAAPQEAGLCRVVFHSMVLQYVTGEDRRMITGIIRRAGEKATKERPLVWISLEWTPARDEVQLWLTCWPVGEASLSATCHAYGNWVHWR